MRFIRRSPFRNRPESIHHPARPIGKLVGKPPLSTERSMSLPREPLKVGDPVISPVGRFLVSGVSRLRKIQSFHGSKPRAMAVAAQVRKVATVLFSVPLFCRDHRTMHHIFWPLRCSLHPLNQLSRMFTPLGILIRMEQNIPRKLERNHLIHVVHAALNVLEIADPDIVLHGIFHKPPPRTFTNLLIGRGVALIKPS